MRTSRDAGGGCGKMPQNGSLSHRQSIYHPHQTFEETQKPGFPPTIERSERRAWLRSYIETIAEQLLRGEFRLNLLLLSLF